MTAPRHAGTSRKMTRAFRKRMLQQAGVVFAALAAVLLMLVGTVDHKVFLMAAMVLIPVAALTFNIMQRRAYSAEQQVSKR